MVMDRTNRNRVAAGLAAALLLLLLIGGAVIRRNNTPAAASVACNQIRPQAQKVVNDITWAAKHHHSKDQLDSLKGRIKMLQKRAGSPECRKTPACQRWIHHYANDAPLGSHQFGPAIADPTLAVARWNTKNAHDGEFTAVWENIVLYNGANDTTWIEQRARQLESDCTEWGRTVDRINGQIVSMSIANDPRTYETYLMVPRSGDVPQVGKTDRPVAAGLVLQLHLRDGRTEEARLVCDLQPVRPHLNAPAFPAPPGPSTPPAPPRCTPPYVPYEQRCIKLGTDDGHGGNQSRMSQPVAQHPQGPTPGAPHQAPPPAHRPPGDTNGGSGNGGHPKPPTPPDTSHSGDTTDTTTPVDCPPGDPTCTTTTTTSG